MSTPPPIANTLLNFWDPAAITGVSDGGTVATLPDRVGGSNLTQATGTKQPIYHATGGPNGTPSITFDGIDDFLGGTGSNVAAVTLFLVVSQLGWNGGGARKGFLSMLTGSDDYGGAGIAISCDDGNNNDFRFVYFTGGQLATNDKAMRSTTIAAYGTYALLCASIPSGANALLYINGTDSGNTDSNSGATNMAKINMGSRYYGGSPTDFTKAGIAAVLVYSGVLTSGDRAKIDSWVQDTYAITVSDYIAAAAATLTGSGSLTATQNPATSAAAALSGSGSLGATSLPASSASATLGGSGALSAAASTPTVAASAALGGSGTLSATGTLPNTSTTAALSGSGTLTSSAKPAVPVAAALAGTGSLTTTAKPAFPGTVALSGTGTLTASAGSVFAGPAALAGTGTLTATAAPAAATAAALAGSGTLSATVVFKVSGVATLSGSGALSGTAKPGEFAAPNLSGVGVLAATATPKMSGSATLAGSGTLTATAAVNSGSTGQFFAFF